MFALFASILGILMMNAVDFGPFYVEDLMLRERTFTLAIEGLEHQQNAAEKQCSASACPSGTVTLSSTPTPPGGVTGTYGTVMVGTNVVSWFSPQINGKAASAAPYFNPDIVTDVAMRSTVGLYNAATGVATGFSTMVMEPSNTAVPAMSLSVAASYGIPNGSIVVAWHR